MEKELVFISWSGSRSKAIAQALYDWLPRIIQAVNPWMSEHDIPKGTRWSLELARGLEKARFGLSCLTPENLNEPWLLFEAGAISKAVEEAYIWTYLFDVEYADIKGPLAQFNHTKANEEETRRLVRSINKAIGDVIRESDFDETFAKWWPDLEECLRNIPPTDEKPKLKRSQDDVLKEILLAVRGLQGGLTQRGLIQGQLVIASAKYGAEGQYNDVANVVKSAIVAGGVEVPVNNDYFGPDPIKGVPKKLTVTYFYAGREYSKTVSEGATLLLP